jgi:hypothetical protein
MNYNFATHATCPLELMTYKYNELQVSIATHKIEFQGHLQNTYFFHSVDIILIIKRGINKNNYSL